MSTLGRPSEYRPEFCEQVLDLGRQGKSVVQMACHFDVVKQTLFNWTDAHPDFLDAFTRAKQLSQDWWETKGQGGLEGSGFNASLWSRSMAARFPDDYTERQKKEITGANGGPVRQTHRIERHIVDPANPDS